MQRGPVWRHSPTRERDPRSLQMTASSLQKQTTSPTAATAVSRQNGDAGTRNASTLAGHLRPACSQHRSPQRLQQVGGMKMKIQRRLFKVAFSSLCKKGQGQRNPASGPSREYSSCERCICKPKCACNGDDGESYAVMNRRHWAADSARRLTYATVFKMPSYVFYNRLTG